MIKIITEDNDRPVYLKWFDENDIDMYTEFFEDEHQALRSINSKEYYENGQIALYDEATEECISIWDVNEDGKAIYDDGTTAVYY